MVRNTYFLSNIYAYNQLITAINVFCTSPLRLNSCAEGWSQVLAPALYYYHLRMGLRVEPKAPGYLEQRFRTMNLQVVYILCVGSTLPTSALMSE